MATFTKVNSFLEALAEKTHNLGTDVLKVMLTNTLPVVANTVKLDIVEIAAGNGYAAGGTASAQTSSAQTGGVYKLVLTDVRFTATTAAIAAFRYIVLYNDTATNKELIGWSDYGSSITLNAGEFLDVDFDAAAGVLTLT